MDLAARALSTEQLLRHAALEGAEIRSAPDGTGGEKVTFTGYACVTNRSYQMWDSAGEYPETVTRGAFAGTLSRSPDVKFLLNHGGLPLARSSGGTLDLREDDTGLQVEARLNTDHADFRYVRSAIERSDLRSMSFAFRIEDPSGGWNEDFTARTITAVDLNGGDVALVNDPANPHTAGMVNMRSLARHAASLEAERDALAKRLAALSGSQATEPSRTEVDGTNLETYLARAYVLRHTAP